MTNEPLTLIIDGVVRYAPGVYEDLPRAVLISLFSWRRANPDDDLPANQRMGWWGDTYPELSNDRIGSRLWLLYRAKLTRQTVMRAKEYAEEALQWLVDDGVADGFTVESERQGLDRLALGVVLVRGAKTLLNIRFVNVWDYLGGYDSTPSPPVVAADATVLIIDQAGNFLIDEAQENNLVGQAI